MKQGLNNKKAMWIGLGSLAAVLAAAAAIFFIRRNKKIREGKLPPRKAPQLHVENPGIQSEFVGAPSESGLG